MNFAPSRLTTALAAHYRLDRELGAGGMATVYLAHDLKHDRDVAIKVLHPDLGAALGSERFLSEIRTTARLQHPHILPLLDSGEADGLLYYVMPVVSGESLRARLERERQLSIADAVRIAKEVASALDYAHRQGVIHRDIKPENILLHDGQALVADFGIALAVQQAGGARMTQTGLSLGTPQYMSPEQAMGERTIDARSDIYALGAITYEMLAGDPPFSGSSVQAIVAKVMTERPTPLSTLRDRVPPQVEDAVDTALAKLPADRFASAAAFSTALDDESGARRSVTHGRAPTRTPAALIAAVVILTVVAAAAWFRPAPPAGPVTRVALSLPAGQEVSPQYGGISLALSPDGSRLAYLGTGPTMGTTQVWQRRLDALDATPVASTVDASAVSWAPDGHALLIQKAQQEAVIVPVDGSGQLVTMLDSPNASWGADNRIYTTTQTRFLLRRTIGGAVDTLMVGDTTYAFGNAELLPDGKSALIARVKRKTTEPGGSEIIDYDFATKKSSVVVSGVLARVLKSGALMYVAYDGNAYVAPFNSSKGQITGPAVPLVRVTTGSNAGRMFPQISVADDGTLAYLTGDVSRQRLAWLDPRGRLIARVPVEGDIWGLALSPDGSRVAFSLRRDARESGNALGGASGVGDVWVQELATNARTRLTTKWFSPRPSWSADGKFVLYARIGGEQETQALFERRADASEPEHMVLGQSVFGHTVGDGRWLPDHRTLLVRTYQEGKSRADIYSITADNPKAAQPVAVTPSEESAPMPSPDGSLVAYISNETGSRELYVQRFPGAGERLLVSHGGASPARWSHDGHSLYFWDQHGKIVIASIASHPALAVTGVRELDPEVTPGGSSPTNFTFDVAADGRILVAEEVKRSFELVLVRNAIPR